MFQVAPYQSADESAVCEIWMQAFNTNADYWPTFVRRVEPANVRVLRSGGAPIGMLGLYRMSQWFGGRSVPCGGYSAVAIAPEYRQRGAAKQLLTHTLRELREQHVPLAALYPSSQAVYRAVGFEQAGSRCHYELNVKHIGLGERGLTAKRVAATDAAPFVELHRRRAQQENGNLERSPGLWDRLLVNPFSQMQYAYVVEENGEPAGYLIYYLDDAGHSEPTNIWVRDWCAITAGAARRLWTLLSDHGSIVEAVNWFGPENDPMLALVAECKPSKMTLQRWMLRITDVAVALQQRGYPAAVGELHLEVTDTLISENSGRCVLKVSDGTAVVEPGGRGDLKCGVRGLVPLYTGLFRPAVLAQLGWITGTPESLATAARLFGGSEPWMGEYF